MDYLHELVRQIKMRPREQWEYLFDFHEHQKVSEEFARKQGYTVEEFIARQKKLFEEALEQAPS